MSNEEFSGALAYSEFDSRLGPVVRAYYPDILSDTELKRIAAMSMPNVGQMDDYEEEKDMSFSVFQISSNKLACSYFRFLRGGVRTLTGSNLVSLSYITERTVNPFRMKPFLELILTSLFRVVVDTKTLKQIYKGFKTGGIIDKKISVKEPALTVKARIIQEKELPMFFWELEKDLGRVKKPTI